MMTEELHKRLEEAAEKAYPVYIGEYSNGKEYDTNECDRGTFIEGATIGAELGYKEAIEVAKGWLKNNVSDYTATYIVGCSKGEFISDFEADMNKLSEESK